MLSANANLSASISRTRAGTATSPKDAASTNHNLVFLNMAGEHIFTVREEHLALMLHLVNIEGTIDEAGVEFSETLDGR